MIANLNFIKNLGLGKFIEAEKNRWTCPDCGGTINVHRFSCSMCGKSIDENTRLFDV